MMRQNDLLTYPVAIFALALLLSGCMSRKYVERRSYALEISRDQVASSSETEAVLRVRNFRVSPRYEGKRLVYRSEDGSYESDFYNEFLTSPDTMITEEVRQWLAGSGLFQQVVDFSGQIEPTHILEGTVTDLYGDFSEGSQPRAALQMEFFLIQEVSGRSRVVFQKRYRKEAALKTDSPEAVVQGWNQALTYILADFERDLREIDLKPGG